MTTRLCFLGIAVCVLLLAWAVGAWLDHSLSQALDGLGSQR